MADWRDALYDNLQYYLGPTGIPERISAAGQMFNPVSVTHESMRLAGRAADPRLSRSERVSSGIGSLTEAASLLVPMAGAASRGPARAISETLTGFDISPDLIEELRFYDEAFPPDEVQEALLRQANSEAPRYPDDDFWVGRDIVDEEGYALVPNERPYEYSDEAPEPWAVLPDVEFDIEYPPLPLDEIDFDIDAPVFDLGSPMQQRPLVGYRPLRQDAYGFENPASPYLLGDQWGRSSSVSPLEMGDYPGAAGMYSRAERAAQNLKQQTYPNLTQVRRELEARGAPPRELDTQMDYLAEKFPAGEKITRNAIQEALSKFKGLKLVRTRKYARDYAPDGGYNGTSSFFTHENVTDGPEEAYKHFWDPDSSGPPLLHTRAAQYDITRPGGGVAQTHHVIEMQSDWAQHRQTLPKDDEEAMRVARNLVADGEIEKAQNIMLRSEFDELYPAPYVKDENDWLDLGVRQSLIDAVNSGSDWITFGNGSQVSRYIGMPIEAARRFYDQQVPKSVDRVLKKFAREAGIEVPRLQKTPFVDGEEVIGFELTPEFREAMRKTNLPSFKNGGLV